MDDVQTEAESWRRRGASAALIANLDADRVVGERHCEKDVSVWFGVGVGHHVGGCFRDAECDLAEEPVVSVALGPYELEG